MRDKRPDIPAEPKTGFLPNEGGLQAEGRFDFTSWGSRSTVGLVSRTTR
jgi:hypothetical protein